MAVPLGILMFCVSYYKIQIDMFDRIDFLWIVMGICWLIYGIVNWGKSYIEVDDNGLTVYDCFYCHKPTLCLAWTEIKQYSGRYFNKLHFMKMDGKKIKIRITDISDSDLDCLLEIIKKKCEPKASG